MVQRWLVALGVFGLCVASGWGKGLQVVGEYYLDNPQLEQYVETALRENPAIETALSRYRASVQKIPQVRSLPDPMLTFTQYIRSPETRVGPQSNATMLSQKLPWFGKLDLMEQVAAQEAAAQYQNYLALARQLVAEVKRTFYEKGYVDRSLRILEEEVRLLEHYERQSQARYSQGTGLQQPVIKLQTELSQLIDRQKMLEQQRAVLVAKLNTLMNQPPEQPLAEVGALTVPTVELKLDELYDLGERNRPELKASLARQTSAEQRVELARKDFWPDVTLSAGMVNVEGREDPAGILMPPPDNGKNIFSVAIGVNLPIWRDKYRAGVLEASENRRAETSNYVRLRNEMEFSIRDQVVRLQTLREQIDLYDRVLLAQAEESLRSSEAAYETGQLSVLELLDSERFLLRTRLISERYRADYLTALSELERAVGTRFPIS